MPYVNGHHRDLALLLPRAGPWAAPHNVYLDLDAARDAMEDGDLAGLAGAAVAAGEPRGPFTFDPDADLPEGRAVGGVEIWTSSLLALRLGLGRRLGYLAAQRRRRAELRRTHRRPHLRRAVVVQVVRQDVLIGEIDPGGHPRRYQYLVDEGEGLLYVDGQVHDVRWSRAEAEDLTTWTYADSGEPVVLPPGKVWWEIIPVGSGIIER